MRIPESHQEILFLQIIGQRCFDIIKKDFLESDVMSEEDLSSMVGENEAGMIIRYKNSKEATN